MPKFKLKLIYEAFDGSGEVVELFNEGSEDCTVEIQRSAFNTLRELPNVIYCAIFHDDGMVGEYSRKK